METQNARRSSGRWLDVAAPPKKNVINGTPRACNNSEQANKHRGSEATMMSGQRRKILTEEEYTGTLSHIIQRDYFPDNVELERQSALQQAREEGDTFRAVEIRREARRREEEERRLEELDRQEELRAALGEGVRRCPRQLQQESLSGFHARVTSEDNAAFEEVQKEESEKRKANERRQQLLALPPSQSAPPDRSPLLASDHFAATPHRIQHQPAESRASLFFVPDGKAQHQAASTNQPLLLLLNNNNAQDEASLMPPPSARSAALVEYRAKLTAEGKKIEPAATRFPRPPQQLRLAVRRDWEGSVASSATEDSDDDVSTDLDASVASVSVERRRGLKRKLREQETLVAMTPVIVPGGDASPIVTWGTVEGTPMVLGTSGGEINGGTTTQSLYRMPEEPHREKAAKQAQNKLENRARRVREANKTPAQRTLPSPLSSSSQKLTPAARSLLESTRKPTPRSGSAFASALRSSYAPTPLNRKRTATSTPARATPRVRRGQPKTTTKSAESTSGNSHITDGLLERVLPP